LKKQLFQKSVEAEAAHAKFRSG